MASFKFTPTLEPKSNLNLNRGITHREDLKVNFNLQPEQTFEADGVLRISTFNTFLDDPGDEGGGGG
jgi:hypothetical protein